ncbi:MAG: ABC transporter substrate-binding protein [Acetobacteraceae bacterium]
MRALRWTVLVAALGLALPAVALSAADPILIATSLPMTGNSAFYGAQGRNGAALAVEEINAAGGVLGRPLQDDVWDNRCNPAEGVCGITQALAEKHYVAVHEGGCSSVALAVMPLVERATIPFVVGSPSATSIARQSGVGGNTWTFKIIPTDDGMLSALVSWIAGKGEADRVAFIGEDTDYGRGGAASFDDAMKKQGKSLVEKDFYQQGTADFGTLIARLKAAKPSLIAVYTIGADGQNFLRQWAEAGGGVGLTGRIFTDQIPEQMLKSGVLDGLTTVHPYDVHIEDPANSDFVARYQKKFGNLPNLTSWISYEGIEVIADALRKAGSTDPAKLRAALADGTYESMFGDPIRFDDHNLAHLPAFILGVRNGQVVVLGKSPT